MNNGSSTDNIYIERGTLQGDPILGYLLLPTLDTLVVIKTRDNHQIQGIMIDLDEVKLSLSIC